MVVACSFQQLPTISSPVCFTWGPLLNNTFYTFGMAPPKCFRRLSHLADGAREVPYETEISSPLTVSNKLKSRRESFTVLTTSGARLGSK